MAKLMGNLNLVLGLGVVLLLAVIFGLHRDALDSSYANWFFRYLHVFFGILWIGLLYYFNFVQIPTMPKVPAELKPGVSKYIAPEALFWFRYAALFTVITGLIIALLNNFLIEALTLQPGFKVIGIGIWLALIMAFNVWFIIWPNQKRALGLVEAETDVKAKSATTGMIFSRINTLLSIPMLYCMVTQFYLPR